MSRPAATLAGIALALVAGATLAAQKIAPPPLGYAAKGEAVYARCGACHTLAYNRTGPKHCGLFGRRTGSVEGFTYSDAMKHSKLVWNEKTLDRFIANPLKAMPGTSMGYAGIANTQERADLIAYLKQANQSAECKQ